MSIKVKSLDDWWVTIKSHFLPLRSANIKTSIQVKTSKNFPKTTLNEMLPTKCYHKNDESFQIAVNKMISFCTIFSQAHFIDSTFLQKSKRSYQRRAKRWFYDTKKLSNRWISKLENWTLDQFCPICNLLLLFWTIYMWRTSIQ